MVHGIGFHAQQALFIFCFCIALAHHINAQCTSTDSNTCYIHRSTTWNPSESNMLQCDGQLKRCVVTCSGDDLSCSSGDLGLPIYVICPVDAVSCVIDCQSTKSCQGITIMANTAKYTEINIGATDAGKTMTIYSPGAHGGELFVHLENTNADFYGSTIRAQQNSSKIDIDCDIGHLCTNNTIEGQKVEGDTASIALSCDGLYSADCSNTNLYCSHDTIITTQSASCAIDCTLCKNTNVYTTNGILDILRWDCGYDSDACTGSQLYCGVDQTNDHSNLIWDAIGTQWTYQPGIGSCGFLTTHPTVLPTVHPTIHPTVLPTTTDINPVDVTTIRIIKTGSNSNVSVTASMDPLYFVVFMLALSLGCVVCILLFWMYHHRKFDKGLNNENTVTKIKHRNVTIASNGSILPLSPRLVPLNTVSSAGSARSGSNRSSQVQYDAVSTTSNTSRGNTSSKEPNTSSRNSVILEPNTIFNPHHQKRHKRSTMDTASEQMALQNTSPSVSQSPSPSPPAPKASTAAAQRQAKSAPNVLTHHDANIQLQMAAVHMAQMAARQPPYSSMTVCTPPQVYLSPISALSGLPSTVSSPYTYSTYASAYTSPSATRTCTTTTTATSMTSKPRKNTTSTEDTVSESDESDESDSSDESEESESYTTTESESVESENTIDGVTVPLNHATQKNKFALPSHYKNMSISTSKKKATHERDDKISMNPQHRRYGAQPPQIPIPLPPQSQLHHIPHSLPYKQTLPLSVKPNGKPLHKEKKHQKQRKRRKHKKSSRHRKKKSHDTIKFGKNNAAKHGMNLSIANSVISQLTELTEATENTERREDSESSSSRDGLSAIASSEYTESHTRDVSESDVDTRTEYTQTTAAPNKDSLTTAKSGSTSYTNDNEQSNTMNSRITYDGTAVENTIESKVLDADIMDDLYDNKIKPLGLSTMIDAMVDDDDSPSPPSPQNVSQSELK